MIESNSAGSNRARGAYKQTGIQYKGHRPLLRFILASCFVVCWILLANWCSAGAKETKQTITILYRDEMRKAPEKLKWHGERLTDDTLYAVALTGASWE